jgi:hypothetical protein
VVGFDEIGEECAVSASDDPDGLDGLGEAGETHAVVADAKGESRVARAGPWTPGRSWEVGSTVVASAAVEVVV